MYGFTTTLTGITFDRAFTRTIAALKGESFCVLSDIDGQHALGDPFGIGKPDVRAAADPARLMLRSTCARIANDGASVRAV